MKSEKEKTQVVILGVLVLVVLAIGAYQFVGKKTQAASTPASKTKAEPKTVRMAAVNPVELVITGEPVDPFAPRMAKSSEPEYPPNLQAPTIDIKPTSIRPMNTLPMFNSQTNVAPLSVRMVPPPEENPSSIYTVTGVVEGQSNIAVVRGAEGARFIVRVGQMVGKYEVTSITRMGVVLKHGSKIYLLRLGAPSQDGQARQVSPAA